MSVNMKQNGSLTKIASLTKAIIPMGLAECYSTEEREVGCWTDGKPLYQKTKIIPFSNFTPIQGGTRYVCQYKEADEEVKKLEGYAFSTSYGYCFLGSKNYEADNTSTNYYWEFDNYYNNLNLTFIGNSASIINVSNVYITYQYTKTTDTAGSGIWTPSGAQAVHYSTAEQIIGTYLGKPLYCKVINFSSLVVCNPQQWATTEVPTSSLNVETLVNSVCTYDGVNYPCAVSCDANNPYVLILNVRTVAIPVKTLIIEYTKTTD